MYNPTTNKLEQQVYKFSVGTKYRTRLVLILDMSNIHGFAGPALSLL